MSKLKIISKKCEKSVINERKILSKLNHPFIINLYYAFQDTENLYLVLDYLSGGDLRFHLRKKISFTEKQSKFLIANLLLSLEYIHSHNIIHRDIKPENLILDSRGYLRLTDFGIARIYNENNYKNDSSGTASYMAPESLNGGFYSKIVDYYGMGVIGYELMFGYRPYKGKDRNEIKENMNKYQIKIENAPLLWSIDSVKFINGLLIKKQEKRLGYKSINEIKNHSWFKKFDWSGLYNKILNAPFIPPQGEKNFNPKYNNYDEKVNITNKEINENNINYKNNNKIFIEFDYFPIKNINRNKSRDNNSNSKQKQKILLKIKKFPNIDAKNYNSNFLQNDEIKYNNIDLSFMKKSHKEYILNNSNNDSRRKYKNIIKKIDNKNMNIIHSVGNKLNNSDREKNKSKTNNSYYELKSSNSVTKRTLNNFNSVFKNSILVYNEDSEKYVNISNNSILDGTINNGQQIITQKIKIKSKGKNIKGKSAMSTIDFSIVNKNNSVSLEKSDRKNRISRIKKKFNQIYSNHDRYKSNFNKNTYKQQFSAKKMQKPLTRKIFIPEKNSIGKNYNKIKREKIMKCLSGNSLYENENEKKIKTNGIIIDTYNKNNINIDDWNKLKINNNKINSRNRDIDKYRNQKRIIGSNSRFENNKNIIKYII